jgi:D-arabinose 1-dehydrogenase-like Zn-dependent alcohol dehydrogenase
MRAVRLVEQKKPVALQQIDVPRPGGSDVLVQVKAAGICHSDSHYQESWRRLGRT